MGAFWVLKSYNNLLITLELFKTTELPFKNVVVHLAVLLVTAVIN